MTRSDLKKAQVYRGPLSIFSDPNAPRGCSDLMQETEVISGAILKMPAIPAVLRKSGCKVIGLNAFRKPLKAMDGFMRVCEKLLGQSPCWHSVFSAGMAVGLVGWALAQQVQALCHVILGQGPTYVV